MSTIKIVSRQGNYITTILQGFACCLELVEPQMSKTDGQTKEFYPFINKIDHQPPLDIWFLTFGIYTSLLLDSWLSLFRANDQTHIIALADPGKPIDPVGTWC